MDEPKPESDADIADASLLFGDESSTKPPTMAEPPTHNDGYDVAGLDPTLVSPPNTPIFASSPRPITPGEKKAKPVSRAACSGVGHVWTRGAEWGRSLALLGLGLIGCGISLYAAISIVGMFLWLFLLLVSLTLLLVLAYPILITLERPVRMTPEQAAKDYFNAFSHLVPHTRRMWLLLAIDGRNSPSFGSFSEFDAYWKRRIAAWKSDANTSAPLNPFDIELVDFKSDKSAGQTEVDASYTARVIMRGQTSEAVATYSISLSLVRGSDKMWYLNSGVLP
jgi:hypothetical protein